MDEKCHKAQEIDLALFLLEPYGSDWQAFRAHYPHCATCSAEVQKWTSLELGLRTLGNVGDNGHPSADTLVAFQQKSPHLVPEEQFKIETHLRSCAACRDEIKMLDSFDFSHVSQWLTDTKVVVSTEVRESWSTRVWNALRPLFLHPAFAAGLVLLLSVPFIRSYYLSSLDQAPLSSDLARTSAPAPAVGAAQGPQKPVNQLEERQAAEPPPSAAIPALSPQESAPVAPAPSVVESVPGAKKAKEDTRPASLAKQSARREDFALKDERTEAAPAASTPSIFLGADDRHRDTAVQWKSRATVEEKGRKTTNFLRNFCPHNRYGKRRSQHRDADPAKKTRGGGHCSAFFCTSHPTAGCCARPRKHHVAGKSISYRALLAAGSVQARL